MANNENNLTAARLARSSGFTLMELLVCLGVFIVIAGAAFSLVAKHVPLFNSQQNQTALNLSLRNAAAQIQIDLANAGSGFYPSADVSSWPIGMTIVSPTTVDSCYNEGTHAYGQDCFDTLRVIKADPTTPPAQIGKLNAGEDECSNGMSIAQSSELFVLPVSGTTLTQLISKYKGSDQFLVISKDGTKYGTAILSKDAQKTGTGAKLSHNPSAADGTNTAANDSYGISTTWNNKLGTDFCNGDWVVRLSPAVYKVDASDSLNPKLARLHPDDPDCLPNASTPYNSKCIVAEQIVGFKVGALVRNPEALGVASDCKPYCYNPDSYGKDWSQVRALRITIIGRTSPENNSKFRNEFDKGPYKIQAISVVVSPRSLTMRDEQ